MRFYRSDQAEIHVTFGGIVIDDESWSVLDGFNKSAENKLVFPGGMVDGVSLGGQAKRGEGTVERPWSDVIFPVYKSLDAVIGFETVEVQYVELESPGKPQGTIFTYDGVLLSADRPGYKAGESEDAMLKITIGAQGAMG